MNIILALTLNKKNIQTVAGHFLLSVTLIKTFANYNNWKSCKGNQLTLKRKHLIFDGLRLKHETVIGVFFTWRFKKKTHEGNTVFLGYKRALRFLLYFISHY